MLSVPGDFSSAAFFIVGALLKEGSDLLIEDVGLNPLRPGLLRVLERMGARIEVHVYDEGGEDEEPRGDIRVWHSPLKGVDVSENELPSLIDEVPALCVAAALAQGRTRILGAMELRVKESDRLRAMATGLQGLGVEVEELEDGLVIHGTPKMGFGLVDSFLDHRIAMAFAILGGVTSDGLHIGRPECVEISYPGFWQDLEKFAKIG
jgi:3-phosphoshikimate 1-carboxyvinyltransferase